LEAERAPKSSANAEGQNPAKRGANDTEPACPRPKE
jgi:hypothetical protein